MNCLTPEVQIPEAFQNWEANVTESSRRRRSIQVSVPVQSMTTGEEISVRHARAFLEDIIPQAAGKGRVRHRRAIEQESDFTLVTSEQTLDFYLGFILDGDKSYTNLSDTKDMIDYAKVIYHSTEPQVNTENEFEPFIPNSGMRITIKVGYEFQSMPVHPFKLPVFLAVSVL